MSISITTGRVLSSTDYTYGWEGTPGSSEAVERINGGISRRNFAVRRSAWTAVGAAVAGEFVTRPDGNWQTVTGQAGPEGPALRKVLSGLGTLLPAGAELGAACVVTNPGGIPQTVTLRTSSGDSVRRTLAAYESARLVVQGTVDQASPYVDLQLRPLGPRHVWDGTPNASTSSEYVYQAAPRRNDAVDPALTNANAWYRNPKGTYDFTNPGTVIITATSAFVNGDLLTYPSANLAASPGDIKGARYRIRNAGSVPVTVYGNTRAYSATAATGDGGTVPSTPIAPGETLELVIPTFTLPTGSTGYRPLSRMIAPAGAVVVIDMPMFETVATEADVPGDYFDGSSGNGTAASVLVKDVLIEKSGEVGAFFNPSTPARSDLTYEGVNPLSVTGYQAGIESRHIVNEVIGSTNPDVILLPASLRRGRLTMLVRDVVDAAALMRMLGGTDVLRFSDSDLPWIGMTFVLDGRADPAPDPDILDRWIVSADFREVIA